MDQTRGNGNSIDKALLEQIQVSNLYFCEELGKQLPSVNGVPICQAMTYDLVQLLNRVAFQELNKEQS